MAALESVAYPFALHSCTSSTFLYTPGAPPSRRLSTRVQFSSFARHLSVASSLSFNHYAPARKFCFKLCSAVQETAAEAKPEETQNANLQTKLYVVNLPFPSTAEDIRDLFAQCGTVTDVEIIRREGGRSKGFAFVTMASLAEAQAAVDKLDSHEVSGRIIRVEFAKQFKKPSPTSPPAAFKKPSPTSPPAASKKPSPPSPPDVTAGETAHKLYVSNLAWKVRSGHLREFFSGDSTPVSASVVFSGRGKAAGYGFVSFATREEAEAALSTLNGKELMGRPLRLKFSEKKVEESGGEKKEEDNSQEKPEQELVTYYSHHCCL